MSGPRDKPGAIRDDAGPLVLHLRGVRMGRGITQEELGFRMGIQASQLSQWERGLKDPGLRSLTAWCAALDFELAAIPLAGPDEGV